MLKIKKISDSIGKHVYTSDGDYFGQVEDVNLLDNKIDGWKIRISGMFMNLLGGARGVVVPQQFVKAVGDIFIVNKAQLPSKEGNFEMPSPSSDTSESGSQGFSGFQ